MVIRQFEFDPPINGVSRIEVGRIGGTQSLYELHDQSGKRWAYKYFPETPNREKVTEIIMKERLEYLRREIRAERISYAEIAELQSLSQYIAPGDVELLEWAGVPEH